MKQITDSIFLQDIQEEEISQEDKKCNYRTYFNAIAKVLVLDVNSWPGQTMVRSPEECCLACHAWPGCNVFVFCPMNGGCGSGCNDAFKEAQGNTNDYSKFGPNGSCVGDDKYPQYFCTLKQSDNPTDPASYGDGPSSGFTTGNTI